MPFIPHTPHDREAMLNAIGISSIESLFDEIPSAIRTLTSPCLPVGLNENAMLRLMRERAKQDEITLNFIGAGAYEHHIPAAVWDIASRGEFMTAYTPYQAEASQGTLQILYEYQTLLANLTGMDVANASLYEGASALAEAVLMAIRLKKDNSPKILIPQTVSPFYRLTLKTLLKTQAITLIELPFDNTGQMVLDSQFYQKDKGKFTALIIPQPNFFGVLEQVDNLTDFAHDHQALVIGLVNPLALALLKEPGQWGKKGADIVCGEAQPLGIPLSSGGPYCGFMTCKKEFVRQMPGRIAGMTQDKEGKRGFTLTLQAREQHIRRAKATSNICTNQGLAVTAVTIYLTLLGFEGLKYTAAQCHANTRTLLKKLTALPGVRHVFQSPFFHEIVLQFNQPVEKILTTFATYNILGGYPLEKDYPALKNCLLLCATETKTEKDLDTYLHILSEIACH